MNRIRIFLAITGCLAAGTSRASEPNYLFEKLNVYQQTGAGVAAENFEAVAGAFFPKGDYDHAVLVYPGSQSPVDLTVSGQLSPTLDSLTHVQTFSSAAARDVEFGFGDYAFTLTGASPTATGVIHYQADAFPGDVPALTAASYTALQDMDTSAAMTVDFNEAVPGSYGYPEPILDISDDSHNLVFTTYPLAESPPEPSTSTSLIIPAGALKPGLHYTFDLSFVVGKVQGAERTESLTFADATIGDFTTAAVPEPANWALMLAGLAFLGMAPRFRGAS